MELATTPPRFDGRTVLVTGATGGLGAEICRRLAGEGGRVVVTDLDVSRCHELLDALPGEGHRALHLDVASEDSWTEVLGEVSATGGLHALVNNAALGSIATVEDESMEHWDQVVRVDQTGTFLGMKHGGPLVEASGGGAIVNICSILGTVGGFGNSFAYHAAKGAVRTMTKNAALHWATRGVRVNSLHPGFIGTPQLLERYEGSERHAGMLAQTPMGRLGTPVEIAAVVAFLASDDAAYMTGSEIYADGGWTAR
ncbi:3alpha(or 20beta)-hydroxysteroid dehydrogenase [Nocardioides zeae]|uniref:3alpha(Or 20beta)-hydroxysteroid dehydrogenase n=1 Tax=Nocardioides zeae TaxID=1457234 RepID=A0ACC6IJJ1_9ACTN|nr:SDR family oxidoreductase [Nocardioides zeae]MDR6174681.1 3alpha(or 20beta)-hydroxysteroid dehydrogenase [Nocardioides zeae]MDR6210750.1 3alpha(or 20beta)-hydroxysteroid dehydrogenase [Nocardioides zeae]